MISSSFVAFYFFDMLILFSTAMYASPLSVMGQVIRTRSVEFMPLPLTIMMLLNCTAWSSFCFYVGDLFIGVPNYIGIVLSIAQVVLYATYCPGGPLGSSESAEMNKSNTNSRPAVLSKVEYGAL